MNNPFESGHIKNYVLAYISVVVIMVLFFVASTLFHDITLVDKKEFFVDENVTYETIQKENLQEKNTTNKAHFQLLNYSY
jgi:uncharacterized protein YxeA